jgi:hypothetical protein
MHPLLASHDYYTVCYRCLGGGEEEAYDIEEFRIRIVDKKYELEGSLAVVQQKLKSTEGDIKNMQDEIHGMGEDLQVRRERGERRGRCRERMEGGGRLWGTHIHTPRRKI